MAKKRAPAVQPRRPPVDPQAAAAFERSLGREPARDHELTTPQAHEVVVRRAHGRGTRAEPRVRTDGTAVRSTTVHVPIALHDRWRALAFETEESMSAIAARALAAYLDGQGG